MEVVVVLGADADARIRDDEALVIPGFPTAVGPVNITYRTRYSEEGYETAVPREMWIDVRGTSESPFVQTIDAFGRAASVFTPSIAIAGNAYVGNAEPKIAFDATPTSTEREYLTSFIREERGTLPRPGRAIDVAATFALIKRLAEHPDPDRLRRAVAQYASALTHWRPGHETMALAHLFIGIETLTPLALRRERERTGMDDDQLATEWGIDERRPQRRRTKVLAHVRREILFRGDDEAASKAREASDGFEHGFLDFDEIRTLATAARDRTATYLREAIFELAEMDEPSRSALLTPPFDRPARSFLTRYLWGSLIGEAADMALPDQEYPLLTWGSRLKSIRKDAAGLYEITPEETITARFNDALSFQPRRYEVWGPEELIPQPLPDVSKIDDQQHE